MPNIITSKRKRPVTNPLLARTTIRISSIIICMVMFLFSTSSILNVYAQHSGAATSGNAVGQGATSGVSHGPTLSPTTARREEFTLIVLPN